MLQINFGCRDCRNVEIIKDLMLVCYSSSLFRSHYMWTFSIEFLFWCFFFQFSLYEFIFRLAEPACFVTHLCISFVLHFIIQTPIVIVGNRNCYYIVCRSSWYSIYITLGDKFRWLKEYQVVECMYCGLHKLKCD